MATSAGFKQECPSCGASVPIRDPKLIGKKTDCPVCKYRFVVEQPAAGDEDEADEKPAAKTKARPRPETAVTAKRPASGAGPSGKPQPVRKRRGEDDDDDDEEEARPQAKPKAKPSTSSIFILGGGLALVAVLLLGVGGYFIFFNKPAPSKRVIHDDPPPTDGEKTGKGNPLKNILPAGGTAEITNLLPNDVDAVATCKQVPLLVNSPMGTAALTTPGAFRGEFAERLLGLPLSHIEQVVLAENSKDNWLFAVVRTREPIKEDKVKQALGLQAQPSRKVERREYYVVDLGDWLVNANRMLDRDAADKAIAQAGRPRQLAVFFRDPHTLVLADVAPLEQFLKAGGQPQQVQQPPPAPDEKTPPSNNYLTINPGMKQLLDRMEAQSGTVVSLAVDCTVPRQEKRFEPINSTFQLDASTDLQAEGLAVRRTDDDTYFTLGLECKKQETADTLPEKLRQGARAFGAWDTVLPRLKLAHFEGDPSPTTGGGKVVPMDRDLPRFTVRQPTKNFKTVLFELQFSPNTKASLWLRESLRPTMVRARGLLEMASGQPRVHALAAALKAYVEQNEKTFPRGIYPLAVPVARWGRPWTPDHHLSWLVAVLPFLGEEYKGLHAYIQTKESSHSPDNLRQAATVVPAFLNPQTPRSSWWVRVPSLPDNDLATTQFVGIAGIGLDAARYAADDTEHRDKLGVFGYERATKLADIPRPGGTIAVAQVPASFKRPWIAGGGATVQGVPETNSIQPFVSAEHDKKRGTYVIMADFSVRFVPETIPNDLFKAMCTLKGADPAQVEKETVLIKEPLKVELKADPVAKE